MVNRERTIVTILPTRIDSDSRSFKQATSISRLGYRSVVVESGQSELDRSQLPFELLSIPVVQKHRIADGFENVSLLAGGDRVSSPQKPFRLRAILVKFVRPFTDLIRFLAHLAVFVYRDVLQVLVKAPRASLYYLHAPYQFLAVYLLSRLYNAAYIYDIHDFYSGIEKPDTLTSYEKKWRLPFYAKLERLCIKHAREVVTVSDGLVEMLRDSFKCTATVIRNVHDFRLDCSSEGTIRERLGLSANDFLVVVIGQAKNGMAIQQGIEALAKLPPHVHLAFVGRRYNTYLEGRPLTKILSQQLHVLEPVKPCAVVPFIRGGDISLMLTYNYTPNYYNSLPNGFFQSVAAELPILYPDLPQIRRLAERLQLGIQINPLSPNSICLAIQKLLHDKELMVTYKRNLQHASQELNGEQEEKVLWNLIVKTLGDQGIV